MEIELTDRELSKKEESQSTTCGMCFDNTKLLSWHLEGTDKITLYLRVDPFEVRTGLFTNRISVTMSKDQFLDIGAGAILKTQD